MLCGIALIMLHELFSPYVAYEIRPNWKISIIWLSIKFFLLFWRRHFINQFLTKIKHGRRGEYNGTQKCTISKTEIVNIFYLPTVFFKICWFIQYWLIEFGEYQAWHWCLLLLTLFPVSRVLWFLQTDASAIIIFYNFRNYAPALI